MTERDLLWVFVGAAWLVGLYLLLFPRQLTERSRVRAERARQRYAGRPRLLRPSIANAHPSELRTRLTGVGFIVIGTVALWQRIS